MNGTPVAPARPALSTESYRSRFQGGASAWSTAARHGPRDTLHAVPTGDIAAAHLVKSENRIEACLIELRDEYLGAHRLSGTLNFEPGLPTLEAPSELLKSILEHLVEGALSQNDAHRPYCHVGVASETSYAVTLYARDNGRALPECSIETLRAFVRDQTGGHVPERVYRLLLADNLVRWLGGSIWIGPTPNGAGTSVFLRLPKTNASA